MSYHIPKTHELTDDQGTDHLTLTQDQGPSHWPITADKQWPHHGLAAASLTEQSDGDGDEAQGEGLLVRVHTAQRDQNGAHLGGRVDQHKHAEDRNEPDNRNRHDANM